MSAPVTARGASTRERMIAATIELLQDGGYAAASVGAVTQRTGVASGTLYRHFVSKEALFVEVFRSVCEREFAAMQAAAENAGDPRDKLAAVVDVFARRALHNPRLAWALLAEPVDPLVDAERLEFRRRYRDLIAGVVAELPLDADPQLTAAALVGAIGEALVGPLAPVEQGDADADAVVATLIAFCDRAVS